MPSTVPPPTDRLRFREYEPGDVDAVIEMFDDDEARRWYPTKSDPDEAEQWIRWNLGNYERHGFGLWALEDRATGVFLGDCGVTYQPVENDDVIEIGYHLQRRHRGNAYALEAARQCLDFAIGALKVASVCCILDPDNESSIRVAAAIHDSHRTFANAAGRQLDLYWTDRHG